MSAAAAVSALASAGFELPPLDAAEFIAAYWAGDSPPSPTAVAMLDSCKAPSRLSLGCILPRAVGRCRYVGWTSEGGTAREWSAKGVAVFSWDEWSQMAVGVENDRVWPEDFDWWVELRRNGARFLGLDGPMYKSFGIFVATEEPWPVWRVLRALELRPRAVVLPR